MFSLQKSRGKSLSNERSMSVSHSSYPWAMSRPSYVPVTKENVRESMVSLTTTPAWLATFEGRTTVLLAAASSAEEGHCPNITDFACLSPSSPSQMPSP